LLKDLHIMCTKFEFMVIHALQIFKNRPVSIDIEWYTINTVNISVLNALSNSVGQEETAVPILIAGCLFY